MPTARDILRKTFGFSDFREGQEPVVEKLLAGRSVVAVFPTGAGKSLCYQLPALMFPGLTLVVSPLIALMKDQIDFLTGRGIAAARFDSTLTLDESRAVYRQLREHKLKLLYVSPERLADERFRATIRPQKIALAGHRRSPLHQRMGAQLSARVFEARASRQGPRRRPCAWR